MRKSEQKLSLNKRIEALIVALILTLTQITRIIPQIVLQMICKQIEGSISQLVTNRLLIKNVFFIDIQ